MSEPMILTPNEKQTIELLRSIKANRGHGELRVVVREGIETQFVPSPSIIPVERPAAHR